MTRYIDAFVIRKNTPVPLAAILTVEQNKELSKQNAFSSKYIGYKVYGCGMDMGFHFVYNLSIQLFCNGVYDYDGAHALKQWWL